MRRHFISRRRGFESRLRYDGNPWEYRISPRVLHDCHGRDGSPARRILTVERTEQGVDLRFALSLFFRDVEERLGYDGEELTGAGGPVAVDETRQSFAKMCEGATHCSLPTVVRIPVRQPRDAVCFRPSAMSSL